MRELCCKEHELAEVGRDSEPAGRAVWGEARGGPDDAMEEERVGDLACCEGIDDERHALRRVWGITRVRLLLLLLLVVVVCLGVFGVVVVGRAQQAERGRQRKK